MKVIGVIVPEFVHYYFMSVVSGIEEEARARGYRVMVAQSNERYDKEVAICEDFYKNKVCGIIVSRSLTSTKMARLSIVVSFVLENFPALTRMNVTDWQPCLPL